MPNIKAIITVIFARLVMPLVLPKHYVVYKIVVVFSRENGYKRGISPLAIVRKTIGYGQSIPRMWEKLLGNAFYFGGNSAENQR
jgi:hypothetical protein